MSKVGTKIKTALRDVFSADRFGQRGDLTGMFQVEYRNEYRNMVKGGINVTDKVVRDYLKL